MPSPDELHAHYLATDYQVFAPEGPFTLRVGEFSATLQLAHAGHDCNCSAFVTAWNPRSKPMPAEANRVAQQALLSRLAVAGFAWWPGAGVDPRGVWPQEESVLAFGMDAAAAKQLGRELGQNAVLVAGSDAVPQLLWL